MDTSLVLVSAISSFVFLGYFAGVREGTVITAIIVGPIVKFLKDYLESYIDMLIS